MPDGTARLLYRVDPYAWAVAQREALVARPAAEGIDVPGLVELLEDSIADMLERVQSHLVNLMAHLTKIALTRNPQVIGHWRTECVIFHNAVSLSYRRSMRQKVDVERLWRMAGKLVVASFRDHGEPAPTLPDACPFALDDLVASDLDLDSLVDAVGGGRQARE